MKKLIFGLFFCVTLIAACTDEKQMLPGRETTSTIIKLGAVDYENKQVRSGSEEEKIYDRVEFYIMNEQGEPVKGSKSYYKPETAEIVAEGLQAGKYTLLVLGIQGNEEEDGAVIHSLERVNDEWLTFPQEHSAPLKAAYFYSRTPFEVVTKPTAEGEVEEILIDKTIYQKHIMGKARFEFTYNNPYVRTAVTDKQVIIRHEGFYTSFSADSSFSRIGNPGEWQLELNSKEEYGLLPTGTTNHIQGSVQMISRSYKGYLTEQEYDFSVEAIAANRINRIHIPVNHPDDKQGTAFITGLAYEEAGFGKILQDDEPKTVYADASQRKFNTADPLQVKFLDNGELMVRFYSPKPVRNMTVKARIPSVSSEFIDLAYFDSIPAFADVHLLLPLLERSGMYRTESGRVIEIPAMDASRIKDAEFKLESEDPYWLKLREIIHGWTISFGLYDGNPDLPDGGPVGNWMGIRPVHCREVVAFFLNFTYMIDMPEHREILKANEDILYGNGGKEDKVTAETVLKQMQQPRSLIVGLVYSGNGVLGLGGGNVFGAYQQAYLQHYFNTYSCEIMFHELGHVMGYSHSSSFTYGPWAQELMNHFYVNNLDKFPVESSSYLDSKNNPNLYR